MSFIHEIHLSFILLFLNGFFNYAFNTAFLNAQGGL